MYRFLSKFVGIIPVTLLALTSAYGQDQPTSQELLTALQSAQARIDSLEREVNQMRGESDQNWLDEARAAQIKALVHEVLEDSETRASLLADNPLSGYKNGFFIQSPDGNNFLKIRGFLAVRYIYNDRDNTDDDQTSGFEISRTRFGFMGHVIDPTWKYKIWTGDNATGTNLLLDAYIQKVLGNGFSVTAGQFKVPFWREWLVSEVNLQFIERSLLSSAAAGSYTQGVKVNYSDEKFRFVASINDGRGEINSSFTNPGADFAISGRGEWLVYGPWSQYGAWESFIGEEPALVIGAAAHFEQGEGGTSEADEFCWTADISAQFGGANLFVAVVGCESDSSTMGDFFGVLAQGGIFLTDQVELIARYEYANSDIDGIEDLSIVSAGINYFLQRWNVRLTADVGYALNAVDDRWDASAAGYLIDTAGEEGQIVVRSQLQLLF